MKTDIVLTTHADGSVTADEFPETIYMSPHLLGAARDSAIVWGNVHVNVANGYAEYLIEEWTGSHFVLKRVTHTELVPE